MSERKIAEKITDAMSEKITNLINETKLFEKIADVTIFIGFYIGAFTLFTSVIGVTNIALNYSNINSNNKITDLLNKNSTKMINIFQLVKDNSFKLEQLENKINLFLEFQKNNALLKSTSISSLSEISEELSTNLLYKQESYYENSNNDNDEDNHEDNDYELLNEML
jgi:hypothetical protein